MPVGDTVNDAADSRAETSSSRPGLPARKSFKNIVKIDWDAFTSLGNVAERPDWMGGFVLLEDERKGAGGVFGASDELLTGHTTKG
ncbi:hypothetical protein [Phaffia rhodozyma]|uniref:Uncharacterized protein n=1 Tax=Phaffia rhodozyma TaxID=264483 RepID=A0A0F7SGG7_PHARH|nr:hypothetical protein [Phaffia rhodozyma]